MSEVRIIKPKKSETEEKKKLRVCAYARVSTLFKEQEDSLENQIRIYREKIEKNPDYFYVKVFADRGISGTTDQRPEFQEMIQLAKDGAFDLILTKSISRFSRNVKDLLYYCEILKENNVNVIFEEEKVDLQSAQGQLMLTLLGAVAQMEAYNTGAHVKYITNDKMRKGKLVGAPNALGYDIEEGKLVVNEDEAQIVRYIYRRYLEGEGAHTIARELENMGVKTKRGNTVWHDSTVMGILKNEKYTGTLLQGKTVTVNNRMRKDNKDISEKYELKNAHEAIVTEEDWLKVQDIIRSRSTSYTNGRSVGTIKNSNQSVFTSKLVCSYCGKNYVRRIVHKGTKSEKAIWQCASYAKRGKASCPYCKAIDEDRIKEAFINLMHGLMENADSLFYLSDSSFNKHMKTLEKNSNNIQKQVRSLERNRSNKEKEKNKLLNLLLQGTITDADYAAKRAAIDEELLYIAEHIERLKKLLKDEDSSKETMTRVKELIQNNDVNAFNKELFDLIVHHIDVGGDIQKGKDIEDDPKALKFVLNINKLDTNLYRSTYEGLDIIAESADEAAEMIEEIERQEQEKKEAKKYSQYSGETCGDGLFDVKGRREIAAKAQ